VGPVIKMSMRAARKDNIAVTPMDRRIDAPRFTRSRILGVALLMLLAAAYVYATFGTERSLTVPGDELVISPVFAGAFHDYIPVTGTIQPIETIYLDAVDGGQVSEVMVEEGAIVPAGQPLVRLTNANLHLQVINSEAQLSEQLNRLASTQLQFEQSRLAHDRDEIDLAFQVDTAAQRLARMRAAESSGAIKRADIEDAALDLERLRRLQAAVHRARAVDSRLQQEQVTQLDASVKGLTSNLYMARRNLDNLVIKAPIAGQLTSLDAHVGESKSAGQRIGQLDQMDRFKVEAQVDEHYLPRVAVGQRAQARLGAEERVLTVTKIYPEVRERMFRIDLEFTGEAPVSVRRGLSMQIRLEVGSESKGLLVANGPFYEDSSGEWLFVLDASGRQATRRSVRLGRRNPESIEVLGGLREGERVITSSYETLKQFSKIRVRAAST
jgi:HlyD family secretion protein